MSDGSGAADIVVFGTGSFAARILFDMASTARQPVSVLIAGRRPERLAWLRSAANGRAALFGTPARFAERRVDLESVEDAAAVLADARPRVVVQAASVQTSAVIATRGDAWSRLVAEGGLSATAVFQALLSFRVARALRALLPDSHLINCCFPDVTNAMLAAAGLPITCGVGNVAILATVFAGHCGRREPGAVKLLAHYQNLAPWRRPVAERAGPPPRVWIDDEEVGSVFERFAGVQLTPEPAIEISGASGVPLFLALAAGSGWRGHVPGPGGLPGGYPVTLEAGRLALDLPGGLGRDEAVAWNARYEADKGLTVDADGHARYSGRLYELLHEVSPDLAEGFDVADLEAVQLEMAALRARLQKQPA